MVWQAFPEKSDEDEEARDENLDEWMDMAEQKEVDEGDVTESEIMPDDLELADETLDDEFMNELGMHVEEEPEELEDEE
jgi:hypothetical protein